MADIAQVIIHPPVAWGLAVIAGLALEWLVPFPFLPVSLPVGLLGAMVFVLALALFAWAIVTMTRAGSNVPTNLPTTTTVSNRPYRFTRNPIYLSMFLALTGVALAFNNPWMLITPVPFALVIRFGVVVLPKHRMTAIHRETPRSGSVLGIAVDNDGKALNIRAHKAVIIGTGGCTSNVNFRRMFDLRLTEEYCGAAG